MRRIHVVVTVVAAVLFSLSCADRTPTAPSPVTRVQQQMTSCPSLSALQAEADVVFGKKSPNANSVHGKIDLIAKAVAKGDLKQAQDHAFKTVAFILQQAKDSKGLPGTAAQVASLISHIFCYAGLEISITDPQNSMVVEPSTTTQVVTNTDATAGVQFPPNSLTETTVLKFVEIPNTFDPGDGPLLTKLDQYPGFFSINAGSATGDPLAMPVVVGVCPSPGIDPVVRQRLRLGHQLQPDEAHFEITPAADANFLQCPTQTSAIDRLPGWLRSVATLVLPKSLHARQLEAFSGGVGGTAGEFSPFAPVDPELSFSGGVGGTAGEFRQMTAPMTAPMTSPQQASPASPTQPAPKTSPKPKSLATLLDGNGACLVIDAPWGTPVDPACRPTITVTTHLGTPMAGVPVSWDVQQGGGKIVAEAAGSCGATYGDNAFITTNVNGVARVCWTLGSAVGTDNNTVVARPQAGGDAPVGVRFVPPSTTFTASALQRTPVVQISCPGAPYDYNGSDQNPCTAAVTDPVNSTNVGTVDVTYLPTPPHDAGAYTANASYTGSASYSGAVAAPLTFHIVAAPVNFTWTGASSRDWNTTNNWSPASVPAALDLVFIPLTSNQPVLSANTTITSLALAPGASLDIGAFTLTTTGSIDAGNTIIGSSGHVEATGSGTLRGTFAVPLVQGGTHTLGGQLTVTHSGGLQIGGTLTVGGFTLETMDLNLSGSLASLVMLNAADHVIVNGNATFAGGPTPTEPPSSTVLNEGVLVLKGNFTQRSTLSASSFKATHSHRTVLAGTTPQTVSFDSPGSSWLANLEISNPTGIVLPAGGSAFGTVTVLEGAGSITGSDFTVGFGLVDPTDKWRVTTTSVRNNAAVTLPATMTTNVIFKGNPQLLGNSVTVTGAVTMTEGAKLTLNGKSLMVGGNFVTLGANATGGRIVMNNAADRLIVGGDATFASGGVSLLSDGVLDLTAGNLTVGAGNFLASGAHTTRMSALSGAQSLTIGAAGNTFGNIEFVNAGAKSITTTGNILTVTGRLEVQPTSSVVTGTDNVSISGALVDNAGDRFQVANIWLYGVTEMPARITAGSVVFQRPFTLAGALTVNGNVNVTGSSAALTLGGKSLTVTGGHHFGTFSGGRLVMQNSLDQLVVSSGGVAFHGGISTLTAGTIVVAGAFMQGPIGEAPTDPQSFAASGSHRTVFVGTPGPQTVEFANPGFGQSHFAELAIENTGSVGLKTNVFAHKFVTSGEGTRAINVNAGAPTLTARALDVVRLTSTGVPIAFEDGGTFTKFQNVTFQNMDPTSTQLRVSRSGVNAFYTLQNIVFSTVPVVPGVYLRAEYSAPNDGNVLNVNFDGVTPATHGGHVTMLPGALTNWSSGEVPVFGNLAQLAAGWYNTCGLKQGGQAFCWGYGAWGENGDGTQNSRNAPVAVLGGHTFTQLAVATDHVCGVTSGGQAYCWGFNNYGELGGGTQWCNDNVVRCETLPVLVGGGIMFTQIVGGWGHTCGLTSAGAAYCWGYNAWGELGLGLTESVTSTIAPVLQGNLTFTQLAAGRYHTCGLTGSGQAYCWGANDVGQLGFATPEGSPWSFAPDSVYGSHRYTQLAIGTFSQHTCGLTSSGQAYCWGDNTTGGLGDGSTTNSTMPVPVSGGLSFTQLTGGGGHTCGRMTTGAAFCWGNNFVGQLGDETRIGRTTPVAVSGGLVFSQIAAGEQHTCGLTSGGAAYCWGTNDYGQLGDGTNAVRSSPVPVVTPP